MKTTLVLAVFALGLAGTAVRAEEWKDVAIVDAHCAGDVKADPDAHTRSCALQCAKYGYGMITADGSYLKFDSAGSAKVKAALQASTKTDHLRATIDGQRTGQMVKVTSISLS